MQLRERTFGECIKIQMSILNITQLRSFDSAQDDTMCMENCTL